MVTLVEANSGVSAGQPLVELEGNRGKLFLTICSVAWQMIDFNTNSRKRKFEQISNWDQRQSHLSRWETCQNANKPNPQILQFYF